jgi:ribonuclease HII
MKYIIGIDEVGRGPLAGPIAVGACLMPAGFRIAPISGEKGRLVGLKDSKRLSAEKRELWFRWLKAKTRGRLRGKPCVTVYAISRVYPRQIDRINISKAANLAAYTSCRKVLEESGLLKNGKAEIRIYLDGGLYVRNKNKQASMVGEYCKGIRIKSIKTVVAGDRKFAAVKLASIVAKVSRDRYMAFQHKKYPLYGFKQHKGYGTKEHLAAVREYGPCPIHRLTFLRKYNNIKPKQSLNLGEKFRL